MVAEGAETKAKPAPLGVATEIFKRSNTECSSRRGLKSSDRLRGEQNAQSPHPVPTLFG